MSKGAVRRKQRATLFKIQGGLCFWCKREMRLLDTKSLKKQPKDLCTIDHLDSRWTPWRGTFSGEYRHVAACAECNNGRDKELHKQIPKEILRRASQGESAIKLARENHEAVGAASKFIEYPFIRQFTFEPE